MMRKLFVLSVAVIMILSVSVIPAFAAGNTQVIFDFENGQPFVNDQARPDVMVPSLAKDGALAGSGSLKIDISAFTQGWDYVTNNAETYFPDGTGYDGYVLRVKTNMQEQDQGMGFFKIIVDGDYGRAEFGGDVKLIDTKGNDVTPDDASGAAGAWLCFTMPGDFDGYVFLPFSGNLGSSQFDPSKTKMFLIGGVNANGGTQWDGSTTLVDSIGYYKGTDYNAIISELSAASAPASDTAAQNTDTAAQSDNGAASNPKTGDAGTMVYAVSAGVAALGAAFAYRRRK